MLTPAYHFTFIQETLQIVYVSFTDNSATNYNLVLLTLNQKYSTTKRDSHKIIRSLLLPV